MIRRQHAALQGQSKIGYPYTNMIDIGKYRSAIPVEPYQYQVPAFSGPLMDFGIK
jgi:hypothetical protein